MSKLICTFEGSSRHVEYTSDAKFKGIMSRENVIRIYNPDGVQVEFWSQPKLMGDFTIKDLIDETDRAGRIYDGKSAASDV